MSVPRRNANFTTGETLAPSKLNSAYEQMQRDLLDSANHRYCHSQYELDFSGIADTDDASQFKYLIKPPFSYEVVAVELVLYEATGTVTNVSLEGELTGWKSVSVEPAGDDVRARSVKSFRATHPAATELSISLSVTAGGAYALNRCYAIVHIRADRGNAGLSYVDQSIVDAPRFAGAEVVAAAKHNSAFSAYETQVTRNTAADRQLRIHVFSLRGVIGTSLATSDREVRVPSSGRRLHSYDVVSHGASGDDVTFTILDEAAATVSSTTVLGNASQPQKTQGTSVNDTQTVNDPDDANDDYKFRFTRDASAPAAIRLAYAVVYFS